MRTKTSSATLVSFSFCGWRDWPAQPHLTVFPDLRLIIAEIGLDLVARKQEAVLDRSSDLRLEQGSCNASTRLWPDFQERVATFVLKTDFSPYVPDEGKKWQENAINQKAMLHRVSGRCFRDPGTNSVLQEFQTLLC